MASHRVSSHIALTLVQEQDLSNLLPFVREFYHHFNYPYDEIQKSAVLKRLLCDPSLGRIYLVHQNNNPIGYVLLAFFLSLEFNGLVAFIDELFIAPVGRQKGVGSQVLAQIEDLCQNMGITAIRLESEANNKRATALYTRSGYHAHQRYIMTKVIKDL